MPWPPTATPWRWPTAPKKGQGLVVWVGTGEGNGRNSVSWGDGVYRSTDGGGSFTNVGLAETHNIPALAVDPGDPDRCFVAAAGHLWGRNPERGLYRTTDGGASWQQVLKVDDAVGACEVVLAPDDPQTIYAGLAKAFRTPWSYDGVTAKGGIWRSTDGGDTWTRLTAGLPQRTGRIGIAVCAAAPKTLYAVVESDQGGTGKSIFDDRSAAGGLFRSDDGGDTWRRVNDLSFRPFYFSRLAVDPTDPEHVYMPGWNVAVSTDGGVTFRSSSKAVHVDHHAIVIDPDDPQRILIGNDGGLYTSRDAGATWDYTDNLALGQFYHVAWDLADPYRVGGGLQDNGSWIGPSATGFKSGGDDKPGILNEDWTAVYGGDGFGLAFDPGAREHHLRHQPGGAPGPGGPGHAPDRAAAAVGRRGSGAGALQLGRAVPGLEPRPVGALPGRGEGLQADRPGELLVRHQPRPDPARRGPHHDRRVGGRGLRHHHRPGRVAGHRRRAVGRHRRRLGARDHRRRQELAGRHAQGRWAACTWPAWRPRTPTRRPPTARWTATAATCSSR